MPEANYLTPNSVMRGRRRFIHLRQFINNLGSNPLFRLISWQIRLQLIRLTACLRDVLIDESAEDEFCHIICLNTVFIIIIFLFWHSCLHGYKMDISFLFTGIQTIHKKSQRHVLQQLFFWSSSVFFLETQLVL